MECIQSPAATHTLHAHLLVEAGDTLALPPGASNLMKD